MSKLAQALNSVPLDQQARILDLFSEYKNAAKVERARESFIDYVRYIWPSFIEGQHHRIVAEAMDRIVKGDLKRLMVFMPPRHSKSEMASFMLPSFMLGNDPTKKIIQASNTGELAVGFGRKVRNLVDSEPYSKLFPNVGLSSDSKAAHRWSTNHGGEYFAVGTGGKVTGRGADLLIIDDPHSEQEAALNSSNIYDQVYEWYKAGPRQRLQPGAAIVIVVTRWSKIDLPGQILKRSVNAAEADDWEIIELPALLDEHSEEERPVWPGFWSLKELRSVRGTIDVQQWQAQYQQNPISEEGALIKREWWNEWTAESPPECEFIIQAWDTAFSAKQTADFSACTTWGVFYNEEGESNLILLDALQRRAEFPDLKKLAIDKYKEFKPDAVIVEAKAAGTPLIFELRKLGVPVQDFTPSRGSRYKSNDKVARVNAITDIFASGFVWAPARRWAEEVIEQCAEFPFGENDDLVDTVAMACLRFRTGGFLRLHTDEGWDEDKPRPRRVAAYY